MTWRKQKRDVTEESEFWIFSAILEAWNPPKCWKPLENHEIHTSYCKKHSILICVDHLSSEQTWVKNRYGKKLILLDFGLFSTFFAKKWQKIEILKKYSARDWKTPWHNIWPIFSPNGWFLSKLEPKMWFLQRLTFLENGRKRLWILNVAKIFHQNGIR